MATICAVCGTKIGGLTGAQGASVNKIEKAKAEGIEIPEPICNSCSLDYINKPPKVEPLKEIPIPPVKIYTYHPQLLEYEHIDFVSSHISLGTGIINQALSSVTDFFGQQSNSYSMKMQEAEQACLSRLKINAATLGANAVIGMQTTYTELTSGHGQILVCMTGTAVKLKGFGR